MSEDKHDKQLADALRYFPASNRFEEAAKQYEQLGSAGLFKVCGLFGIVMDELADFFDRFDSESPPFTSPSGISSLIGAEFEDWWEPAMKEGPTIALALAIYRIDGSDLMIELAEAVGFYMELDYEGMMADARKLEKELQMRIEQDYEQMVLVVKENWPPLKTALRQLRLLLEVDAAMQFVPRVSGERSPVLSGAVSNQDRVAQTIRDANGEWIETKDIIWRTGLGAGQVRAALSHLMRRPGVEMMIEKGGPGQYRSTGK